VRSVLDDNEELDCECKEEEKIELQQGNVNLIESEQHLGTISEEHTW